MEARHGLGRHRYSGYHCPQAYSSRVVGKLKPGMNTTVRKYPLEISPSSTITLPKGAEILSVGVDKYGKPSLWAFVDTLMDFYESRTFLVAGDRQAVAREGLELKFLGTFLQDDQFIWHIFEAVDPSKSDRKKSHQCFAVLRIDWSGATEVKVVEVVLDSETARRESTRLNALSNSTSCSYTWQATLMYPNGGSDGG